MESYLMITQINDFIFCPRSIFFSGIYRNTADTAIYHQAPQKIGTANHAAIDEGRYSTRKDVITGLSVWSEKYSLLGRIDILFVSEKLLVERKYSISAVYPGFRYQLYAQYFALLEMGYEIKAMRLHSVKDNKNYEIALPTAKEINEFESVLQQIRSFSVVEKFSPNINKCAHCIYRPLCDAAPDEVQ